jgi:UDP-N-acetylglucosamine 1-carboxyvinyltransferase
MRATLSQLRKMGCEFIISQSSIQLLAPRRLLAASFETEAYPGMPTDMQAQFVAALCLAEGRSRVKETIFSARFSHASELAKMGARIAISSDGRTVAIAGRKKLHAASVNAYDLRCGAALICAALAAEGESTVGNVQYVERGYEKIEEDLRMLGAEIQLTEAAGAE